MAPAQQLIGALDQGTTSSRFIMFKSHSGGEIFYSKQIEHEQHYPKQGWVEHDPEEIYKNCAECIDNCVAQLDDPSILKGFGITNQRETTVVWDRNTGKPLHNAIVWLDMRTQETCNQYPDRKKYLKECGLPISTYFSGMKLKWLLDNVPAVRKAIDDGSAMFGTIDCWLLWKLTGGENGGVFATDVTNASRTMLMNISKCEWSDYMCKELGNVNKACLPEIRSSSEIYGHYNCNGVKIPIAAILGDQQSALVGQGCFDVGQGKNTYGTGCFFMVNTGEKPSFSENGLLTTLGYKLGKDAPTVYALEGSVAVAGACVQWLRDNLQIIKSAPEVEANAALVTTSEGVYFVPAFSGLFAPHWDESARGTIVGMSLSTNKNHICRAAIEAICYQVNDVLEAAAKDSGSKITLLKVDGGASANNIMMQFQSDIIDVPISRPRMLEVTALGVEMAAGLALGIYTMKDFQNTSNEGRRFQPKMDDADRQEGFKGWNKAIEKSKNWQ